MYEISYGSLVNMVGPNKLNRPTHAFVAVQSAIIIFVVVTTYKIK